MPVAVHAREPRFLFFWNHKAGSRSLEQALTSAFADVRVHAQPAFRPPLADAAWPRFVVTRCPWARAISCWRNKCRDAPSALARNGALEPCQKHLVRRAGFRRHPRRPPPPRSPNCPSRTS